MDEAVSLEDASLIKLYAKDTTSTFQFTDSIVLSDSYVHAGNHFDGSAAITSDATANLAAQKDRKVEESIDEQFEKQIDVLNPKIFSEISKSYEKSFLIFFL